MRKQYMLYILLSLICFLTSCKQSNENVIPKGIPHDLLAADLSNCNYPSDGWSYQNGELTWLARKGDVWTKAQYDDFILEFEWKIASGCNSGIIFRCADPNDWLHTGLELQIHEDGDGSKHGQVGAIYDLISPSTYRNSALLVTQDGNSISLPPLPNQQTMLTNETKLIVKKVYTNLKLRERKGQMIPYNAESTNGENNPALLCELSSPNSQDSVIVYPDGTRDAKLPANLQLAYQLGDWIEDEDVRRPIGEWNTMRLKAQGPLIEIDMNGKRIVDLNLDDYTVKHRNPNQSWNKYPVPAKDLPRKGYIALQDHGKPVWFRNVRITKL